jgi:CIC family chloride channel protein
MRLFERVSEAFAREVALVRLDKATLIHQSREFLVVALVGLAMGLAAFLFHGAVELLGSHSYQRFLDYESPHPARTRPHDHSGHDAHKTPLFIPFEAGKVDPIFPHFPVNSWWLVLIPTLGGLGVGLLSRALSPQYWGETGDVAIHAVHNRDGYTPGKVTAIKMASSALTVGTGGSSGLEGPIMQGGSGIGSLVAERFGVPPDQRRRLAIAGMAAGVAALFRAPLGGAFYAIEVLYRDSEFEGEALLPAFLASIIAYSVYCPLAGQGWGALFDIPPFEFNAPLQLFYYALMAAVLAVLGGAFVKIASFTRWVFRPRRFMPKWLTPALGGLCLGLLALKAPYVLGSSYGYLQEAMDGRLALSFLLTLGLLKIIATTLTLGSGGSGGVFAPALVIGGMIGGAFGAVGQKLGIVDHAAPMVVVGMAAFFAGVSKTPVAAMIMALEMTSGYGLLVPLMLSTGVTYLLVPRFIGIHHSQVNGRRDSPAHRSEYVTDVLRELRVDDLVDADTLPPMVPLDATLDELNILFTRTRHQTVPVVDENDNMEGVALLSDIKEHLLTADFGSLILAADIMRTSFEPIKRGEDASQALGKLLASGAEELPVVEEAKPEKVIGTLSRADITRVYYERMRALATSSPSAPAE